MNVFLYTIASAAFISALSFSGALLLLTRDRFLRNLTIFLVALAAATLLGTAFLHFLPEALEEELPESAFLFPIIGFALLYAGEKLLHLHHATERDTGHNPQELGILSLAGDFVHNFIDGIILVAAFLVDAKLGFITAAGKDLNRIPEGRKERDPAKTVALFLVFFGGLVVMWLFVFLE